MNAHRQMNRIDGRGIEPCLNVAASDEDTISLLVSPNTELLIPYTAIKVEIS